MRNTKSVVIARRGAEWVRYQWVGTRRFKKNPRSKTVEKAAAFKHSQQRKATPSLCFCWPVCQCGHSGHKG